MIIAVALYLTWCFLIKYLAPLLAYAEFREDRFEKGFGHRSPRDRAQGVQRASRLDAEYFGVRSRLDRGAQPHERLVRLPQRRRLPGVHRDPIFYTGTVDSNFTMIDGDWRFANGFSGRFVLVRVSRGAKAMEVERAVALGAKR